MKGFKELYAEAREHDAYWEAAPLLDAAAEIQRVMAEEGLSRADLARALKTSPAYITKALRGDTNFTVATLARVARALGREVRIRFAAEGVAGRWVEVPRQAAHVRTIKKLVARGGATVLRPDWAGQGWTSGPINPAPHDGDPERVAQTV